MAAVRAARRLWSRLRGRLGRRHLDCFYSPSYRVDLGGVPFDPQRGERILGFLLAGGLIGPAEVLAPPPASLRDLLLVHTADYLDSLHSAEGFVGIVGYPVPDELRERALDAQRHQVGGTVAAALAARDSGRPAVNLGGGLHHAGPAAGAGFCLFNDIAVAVARLRESGFDGRVLVVDLDLHDGNGTRACFAHDPTVFSFSIHNRDWDLEPAVASRSLTLDGEVDDRRLLAALASELPPVVAAFRPELVFYLAGADVAADDALGDWSLTAAGMLERDRLVLERFGGRRPRLPLVVTLAGGYGSDSWRYPARLLAWMATGRLVEPPSTEEATLLGYRRRILPLGPGRLDRLEADAEGPPGADWGLTEEDVYGDLGASARPARFLGFYSRHALELLLETSGLLDLLRALGFAHPTLELDLGNPSGDTLRLSSGPRSGELLMELRVRRDRTTVPGHELLRLEWLLLQNPRRRFSGDRSPLPGQTYPGLGLLNDVMALLVLVCERLELAGILFVPSHFHLGSKGRRFLRFLDPEDAGWLRAVERAVAGLPLPEATRAVAGGRLRDAVTGAPVHWRPMTMILPTSEELARQVDGEAYRAAVAAAAERHRFELAR